MIGKPESHIDAVSLHWMSNWCGGIKTNQYWGIRSGWHFCSIHVWTTCCQRLCTLPESELQNTLSMRWGFSLEICETLYQLTQKRNFATVCAAQSRCLIVSFWDGTLYENPHVELQDVMRKIGWSAPLKVNSWKKCLKCRGRRARRPVTSVGHFSGQEVTLTHWVGLKSWPPASPCKSLL